MPSDPEPAKRSSSGFRRWVRPAIALALLVLVVPALLLAALRSESLHARLVAVADRTLREQFQIGLDVERVAIQDLGRTVVLEGVTLGETDRPFVRVERAEAVVRRASLLSNRPTLELLRLDGVAIDLGAAPPRAGDTASPAEQEAEQRLSPVVETLTVRDLSLVADAFDPSADVWLDRLVASDVAIDGALIDDRIRIDALTGGATLESHRRAPLDMTFHASGNAGLDGSFSVPSAEVRAEGLSVTGSAEGSLTSARGWRAETRWDAQLGRLFPDLTPDGVFRGDVGIAIASDTGLTIEADIETRQLPADLVRPWVADTALDAIDWDGSRFDATIDGSARVALEPFAIRRLDGRLELDWLDDRQRRLVARASAEESAGARVAFSVALLPDAPGERRIEGTLDAPDWNWPAVDARIDAAARIDTADLANPRWYLGLDRAMSVRPTGDLIARATVVGPLTHPELDAHLRWSVDSETVVLADARTVVDERPFVVDFDATLLPTDAGTRRLRGRWTSATLTDLDGAALDDVRATWVAPDLPAAADRLNAWAGRLLPEPTADRARGLLRDAAPWLRGSFDGTVSAEGPLDAVRFSTDATWRPASGERVGVVARGTTNPAAAYGFENAAVDLEIDALSITNVVPPGDDRTLEGRLHGRVRLEDLPLRPAGSIELRGDRVRAWNDSEWADVRLTATADGTRLNIVTLSAVFDAPVKIPGIDADPTGPTGTPRVDAVGSFSLQLPLKSAELEVDADHLFAGLSSVGARAVLQDGVLHVVMDDVRQAGERASLSATVPLGSLGRYSDSLAGLPLETATGPVSLTADAIRVAPLLQTLGFETGLDAQIDGTLEFDPEDPVAARGDLRASDIRLEVGDDGMQASQPLRLTIENGTVRIVPVELKITSKLQSGGTPLEIAGTLELNRDWQPGDPLDRLPGRLDVNAAGTVEASLLNPFVPGVRATGAIDLALDARGSLLQPDVTVALTGKDARLLYVGKYPLTVQDPDLRVTLRDGQPRLDHLRGRLNGGRLDATGERLADGTVQMHARVDDARLRLDLGVTAKVDADLSLRWPQSGMRDLTGNIVIDRGVLRRDVNLEREALRVLFEPDSGANLWQLDQIALDLTIDTREGVFIDNNLADLHADWSGLRVGGTLGHPLLDGHVDVAPGGWLNAFGTVFRIDELSLSWANESPSDVRVVIETTSSIDDPALLQQYRGLAFAGTGNQGPGTGGQLDFRTNQAGPQTSTIAATMANYYQDKLAGSISGGRTEFSFEPVPLFGETDTQARYTLWQHVNANTSLIWSIDPRQAEAQTWIVDLHGFRFAPRWRMQLFTNDASLAQGSAANSGGATLQQTVEFGGGTAADDPRPKLRKIHVLTEGAVSKRRIRSAIGYRKGDPFDPGAVLDVEVDVIDLLRRRGYPTGETDVRLIDQDDGRAILEVEVRGGDRVRFDFQGEKLTRPIRRRIRSLYRPLEQDERAAQAAMREETAHWLRAKGFLETNVQVEVVPPPAASPGDPRTVRVVAEGGRRIEPGAPTILGVEPQDAAVLAAQFDSQIERVELAAGLPDADAMLVQSLRAMGYPHARVVGRDLSEDGTDLSVDVAPGPRQQVRSIAFEGIDEDRADVLSRHLLIAEGDPPRFADISRSAHRMEDALAAEGHVGAQVRAWVRSEDPEHPLDVDLRFDVSPGPIYRISDVRFKGLKGSRRSWVENNAGLEPGQLLRRTDIAEARRSLYRTGVFRRIHVEGDRPDVAELDPDTTTAAAPSACGPLCVGGEPVTATPAGSSPDVSSTTRDTEIVFDMQEKRRYQLSYGLRWENDTGVGVVIDAVDRNSLGRGHTSGARLIYGSNLKTLRFYHQIPRIVGHRSSLEFFLEGSEEQVTSETTAESVQFWTQFTTTLGRRTQTRVYSVLEETQLVSGSRQELDDDVASPRLGWQWIYSTVDRALGRDRKGWFVGLDISGAHVDLGSDATTVSAFEHFKLFVPFGKKRFNWAQSWRLGLVDARDAPIPTADRLRAGGSYSIRGYPTNTLGPVGPNGEPLGGEVQLIVNQELHYSISRAFSTLVFFDTGNIWQSLDSLDSELRSAVGLGVRYVSPVGPLRLDVAWPLDRRPDDPTYQIYFGFGQVF